ncbi:MAG: CDP-alcohol phosphatidyltransferase family protein [Oscillospiraceae bacterium]|nr:CDP-alcohol phosphatidyltransferase family protein [Oscillospiraceae bacterium]MDY3065110.1 CDP-alcohol phosphatidyltransferase family protein [Oscillospiraceae bacterium]
MKYSTIRKEYQHHELSSMVFVDPYATLLSPFVTKMCIKLHLIPNVVTLCMIGSGIIGAILFALPFLWSKILGTIFIHLWYVFDCSDGEVARITKRFSKFGTEIDYTAHVINHPLFLFSFLLTLLQAGTGWSTLSLCLIFFGVVALNLIFRVWVLFGDIYRARMTDGTKPSVSAQATVTARLKRFIMFFVNILLQLPNFCLIFPIVYFISAKAAVWYAIAVLAVNIVMVPFLMLLWLRKIVTK